MVIDLKKLRQSGKEYLDFCFEYFPEESISTIVGVEVVAPIKVVGTVEPYSKKSAFVDAEITFTLKGSCTRCLTETERTFVIPLNEEYFDINESQEDDYTYINDRLDLTKSVFDTVLINLPVNFLCAEDCKGIDYGAEE